MHVCFTTIEHKEIVSPRESLYIIKNYFPRDKSTCFYAHILTAKRDEYVIDEETYESLKKELLEP